MHLLSDSKDCITPLWITVSVSLSLSSSRCHSFTFLYRQQDCDHQDESEKQEHLFASTEWQVSFTYFLVPTARLRPPRWVWCPTWQSWVSTCSRNACLCPLSGRCHSLTFWFQQQDWDRQDESDVRPGRAESAPAAGTLVCVHWVAGVIHLLSGSNSKTETAKMSLMSDLAELSQHLQQERLFVSTEWQVSFTYFLVPTARLRPPRWVWCPTWQSWVSTCSRNACLCPLRGSSFSDCTTMCVRPQSACCTWPGSADSRNWCLVLVSPMAMTPRLSMWVKLCLYLQSESFPLMDFKATCYANLYKQNSTTSKSFFLLLSAPPPPPPCIPVIFLLCPIMPMCVCVRGGGGGGGMGGCVCVGLCVCMQCERSKMFIDYFWRF